MASEITSNGLHSTCVVKSLQLSNDRFKTCQVDSTLEILGYITTKVFDTHTDKDSVDIFFKHQWGRVTKTNSWQKVKCFIMTLNKAKVKDEKHNAVQNCNMDVFWFSECVILGVFFIKWVFQSYFKGHCSSPCRWQTALKNTRLESPYASHTGSSQAFLRCMHGV